MRVAIVGAGLAGSILARVAAVQGHDVTLIERGAHPRFALGESSTPLAAICLERLADRYDLPDLRAMAAYGRWTDALPELRRGLKRGFTFYWHERNRPFSNTMRNRHRLLVAASPNDTIADAHWLREDVDAYLTRKASERGVRYLDRTQIDSVIVGETVELRGSNAEGSVVVEADFAVDATGAGSLFASQLDLPAAHRQTDLETALVYAHFEGVRPFADVASVLNPMPLGPYPDDKAAVHHLLREGWMYQLPFDHGVVSAGFVIVRGSWWDVQRTMTPDELWSDMLYAYPSLVDQFADASPVTELQVIPLLQRAVGKTAGPNWALLPHGAAFWSPMFSTGIAWSLVAVERLAHVLEDNAAIDVGLSRYDALVRDETQHLERLIAGAYAVRSNFDVFAEYVMLYFAAASFAETSQRLLDAPVNVGHWCWDGFLGARDPAIRDLVAATSTRVREASSLDASDFAAEIKRGIEPRNVAGLSEPARNRLYPVDLDELIRKADLLGLSAEEIRIQLPRLRGLGNDD